MCLCIVSSCSGCDGCCALCLIYDEYSLRYSWSSSIFVSPCTYCVLCAACILFQFLILRFV